LFGVNFAAGSYAIWRRIRQLQKIADDKIPTYQEAEEILKHNYEKSFKKS
jgi:hypothetical protein